MPDFNDTIRIMAMFAGLLIATETAQADCVSACQASTYCDSEMNASGECGRRLNDCYLNECNRKTYGAIAYDAESGAVGWSYDFEAASDAEQKALAGCGEQGGNCKVVYDFWNACAALAAAEDGSYAVDHGDSQEDAEGKALAGCAQNGGHGCEIKAWSCTGL
jgi:hypothetical protein